MAMLSRRHGSFDYVSDDVEGTADLPRRKRAHRPWGFVLVYLATR
jgi:hypothetical protein